MKKAVSVILIIVILINLITVKSFAEETGTTTAPTTTQSTSTGTETTQTTTTDTQSSTATTLVDPDEAASLIKDPSKVIENLTTNTTTVTDEKGNTKDNVSTTGTTYMGSTAFGILSHLAGSIPQVINQVLELIMESIGGESMQHFTIFDTVMGNYELFDISYNDVPENVEEGSPMHVVYKSKVIHYYFIVRNISIALILFILIYIGIRMAVSTLSTEKAKYKKMLEAWVVSLILVFAMHYIIIFICAILNNILGLIRDVAQNMYITDTLHVSQIESQIFTDASVLYGETNGWNLLSAVFTMWVLIYYQLKFFMMYIGRIIEIGFLIIISPLVTITYSIDKIGDGRAQAFKTWLNELLMKASIQVVHAIIYLIFIGSAGYIATQHPLLAAVFFALLSRSEKIIKNALNVKNNEFERVKVPFAKH